MIVVMLTARNPPQVLDVTSEQVILIAREASEGLAHTHSVPVGTHANELEEAWAQLTKDAVHARRFEKAEDALSYYLLGQHGLPVPQVAAVITKLRRLKGPTAPR